MVVKKIATLRASDTLKHGAKTPRFPNHPFSPPLVSALVLWFICPMDGATLYMIVTLADGSMQVAQEPFETSEICYDHLSRTRERVAWCIPDRARWLVIAH